MLQFIKKSPSKAFLLHLNQNLLLIESENNQYFNLNQMLLNYFHLKKEISHNNHYNKLILRHIQFC